MVRHIEESWRRFSASRPGYRFQERYRYRKSLRRKRARRVIHGGWLARVDLARIFYVGLGLLLIATSAVAGWLPVLGWGTFFLGLGLIAGEFKPIAHLMDWLEVRGRKVFLPLGRAFMRMPTWAQLATSILIAVGTFGVMYWVFFRTFLG